MLPSHLCYVLSLFDRFLPLKNVFRFCASVCLGNFCCSVSLFVHLLFPSYHVTYSSPFILFDFQFDIFCFACSLILSFILIFSILHSTDLCAVMPFCEVVYFLHNLSQVVVKLFISSLKRGSSKGSFTCFVHERIHVICSYMISVQ